LEVSPKPNSTSRRNPLALSDCLLGTPMAKD
jgi:hypothetical protein